MSIDENKHKCVFNSIGFSASQRMSLNNEIKIQNNKSVNSFVFKCQIVLEFSSFFQLDLDSDLALPHIFTSLTQLNN